VSRVPVTDEDVKDSVTTTLSSGFATCSELTSKMAQSQSDRQRVSTGPTIVLSGSQLLSITGQLQRHLVQIVVGRIVCLWYVVKLVKYERIDARTTPYTRTPL